MFNYFNVEELKAEVEALKAENEKLIKLLGEAHEEIDYMLNHNRYE